ncbi:MAG: Helicase associated domain protein [Candidatus Scalindua sp.]|nr:Helicase associated domain protein [Candidatus Scalindua sp.]
MLPKHHKTGFFLKIGLFDNLTDFAELEARISKLPTTVEVGDAFEVFAEAYFFTQKIEQAEEVWPFKSIPSAIKEDLSLGTNQQDMGVDGAYKTTSGTFNAYQAKFRTDRPSLTWTEISTFMGLTDNVNQRVLFTNSNDITSVINERSGFHCIRGNDLDRLDKKDFETILKWLQSGEVEVERKTPLPHQSDAIKDILNTLEVEDRATALMACGTGKTLVALWVSEQMGCQNILVLLPSLTLVRQTLHEWLKETEWQHLSYLCVCSDPTVASRELDGIKINQSDLDFAVTTEGSTVKQFLSQNSKGVKIVFSTYQSAHIVAEGMDNSYRFDLGIFDEAHKTAGREGKMFGFALKDDNLYIKKRLFLTATPRHYNLNKRNKEGDLDLVYSMDNPDVYGEVAHELSFAKAARQDIICNYKVIISVVTSEQVNKEMLKRGEVLINGDIVNAQLIANQIAFREAINKYNIKRIFTFHKSVATAKSFTGKGSEGIRTQLPEFNTFHVNGTMPTAVREGIMNEFKYSDSSVISNARCLTEGVDLPAVDMVAFMSPKKSKVDIVQATGRAMRKDPQNPDKALGYILVPLYLEITTGESIEDAVAKADFGEIWNVLQALQEQDEMLTDIIRQMQEDKGKGGDQKGDDFGEIIETIGVDILLKTLQESITAVCVEKLGFTWDLRYGELIKYKERFGDCNVPGWWAENKQLGKWVHNQRTFYRKEKLGEDRIKRLEDIGFVWSMELGGQRWAEMFGVLKEYRAKHGDCNVPFEWPDKQLYRWVHNQRTFYRKGKLSEDRIERLEDIGFVWSMELGGQRWTEMFGVLKEYKAKHGDCNVPQHWTDSQLYRWVHSQRTFYRKGKLSEDRIERLEDIGFVWSMELGGQRWTEMLGVLKEYKAKHGNCNVPQDWTDSQLYRWVHSQRTFYRKGKLSEDRIERLEDIGFVWSMELGGQRWTEMLGVLKEYKEKQGDCNVSPHWTDRQLYRWVHTQRTFYRKEKLSEDRIKRLEDMGFVWNIHK